MILGMIRSPGDQRVSGIGREFSKRSAFLFSVQFFSQNWRTFKSDHAI